MKLVETVKEVKDIKNDEHASQLGYTCLGKMSDVYPNMNPDEWYRTWIWENANGERIALWDEGNSWCHYMCGGTEEALNTFFEEQDKTHSE